MKPIRLLIVDDDAIQRALMRFLIRHNYPTAVVSEAQDGRAALANYETEGADLIVTDIDMPILDGIALTVAVRAHNSSLPIVVVSGMVDGEALARRAGATQYVNKAVLMTQLPQIRADVLAI